MISIAVDDQAGQSIPLGINQPHGSGRFRHQRGAEGGCAADARTPESAIDSHAGIECEDAQGDIAEMIVGGLRHHPAVRPADRQDAPVRRLALDAGDGARKQPGMAAFDDMLLAGLENHACRCHFSS